MQMRTVDTAQVVALMCYHLSIPVETHYSWPEKLRTDIENIKQMQMDSPNMAGLGLHLQYSDGTVTYETRVQGCPRGVDFKRCREPEPGCYNNKDD
jgi:hypothetical protein